ncbi:MAG: lysine--tRNA ligase [candidate division WOR-3 bacterium]
MNSRSDDAGCCSSGERDRAARLDKLSRLRALNIDPYPASWQRTHQAAEVLKLAEAQMSAAGSPGEMGQTVAVAGRVMSRRQHGKTEFWHIQDGSGRIQLYLRRDVLGEEVFNRLDLVDMGDIVGASGEVFKTRTGETTVNVRTLVFLAKSLRPLPEKFHGLKDIETRYRQRYLDLIVNADSKRVFLLRARLTGLIRRFLDERGFVEVETPILQPIYGGAAARPFETFCNALEQKMFLRIADELYLKRLVVGGMERVYEIGKDFRNEGVDRFHNPEFTQLELYCAYADYNDMMVLVEELFRFLALELTGKTAVSFGGQLLDFGRPWARVKFVEALAERTGENPLRLSREQLIRVAARCGIETDQQISHAKLLDKLFSELVQEQLTEPTFVVDYPKITTPLAKVHRDNPELVERFEPVVCGMELGNAFSELNDPIEQRERFEEAVRQNEEYATVDEDYCAALEHGMPPTGGLGLGIDRLTMLFADAGSIRDVILFPQLRARSDGKDTGE